MFGDWDNELGNLKLFNRLDALIIRSRLIRLRKDRSRVRTPGAICCGVLLQLGIQGILSSWIT